MVMLERVRVAQNQRFSPIALFAPLKKEEVLVRKNIEPLGEREPGVAELGNDLVVREFHLGWRSDGQIFLVEIDYYDSPIRLQRFRELGVISGPVVDVMNDVTKENGAD